MRETEKKNATKRKKQKRKLWNHCINKKKSKVGEKGEVNTVKENGNTKREKKGK